MLFLRPFAQLNVIFRARWTRSNLFGHRIRDHQPTCRYDLLAVHGSIHRQLRRLSYQPGLYHRLSILFAQNHGRAVGPLVQYQALEQVERRWDLHRVNEILCMLLALRLYLYFYFSLHYRGRARLLFLFIVFPT